MLEAIALQVLNIMDTLNAKIHPIQESYVSDGQANNALLVQLLANVRRIPIIIPGFDGGTGVILHTAILVRATRCARRSPLSLPFDPVSSNRSYRKTGTYIQVKRGKREPPSFQRDWTWTKKASIMVASPISHLPMPHLLDWLPPIGSTGQP